MDCNIFPVLDIETNNLNRSCTEISDRCIQFLEEFKKLSNLDCIIYSGGFFARDNLDNRVKKYNGWIAHYGVSQPMKTGFNTIGHQYSENGKVDGINVNVDLDNFSDDIYIDNKKKIIPKPIEKPHYKLVPQEGTCTVIVDQVMIREEPSTSSQSVGSYNEGESVNYDYYVDNEGYRWISWVGASGKHRYMAVRVLSTNKRYGNCI